MQFADLKTLSGPIQGPSTSGENLEYDARFVSLFDRSHGTPERQYGDTLIAAEAPDWEVLLSEACQLSTESRDLRLGALIVECLAAQRGFAGIAEGLKLIANWASTLWDSLHPGFDPNDPNDVTARVSALGSLTHSEHLVAHIVSLPLADCPRLGRVSLTDIRSATSTNEELTGRLSTTEIEAMFLGTESAYFVEIEQQIAASISSAQKLENCFQDHTIDGWNAEPLISALKSCQSVLGRASKRNASIWAAAMELPETEAHTDSEASHENSMAGQDLPSETELPAGQSSNTNLRISELQIDNRADAMAVLDSLCRYFQNHEPASPVPLLLERAKRLIPMSFVDILRELAPDGLSQAMQSVGATSTDK